MMRSNLCRKCAAKERETKPNPLVDLGGVVLTKAVEERLRKRADEITPYRIKDYIGRAILWSAYSIIAYLLFTEKDQFEWFSQTTGFLSVAYGLKFLLGRERAANINFEVKRLAEKREKSLHETRRFYISAEWRTIRNEIIQKQKNICKNCGRTIKRKVDVTVDHIKPRSKFPEFALQTSNLRVLCRKCNSAKGAKYSEGLVV